MKRKRLDRDIWTSIKVKRYVQRDIDAPDFKGVASLLSLLEVEPVSIWKTTYGQITVCAAGMKWLQLLPGGENYLLTAMISAKREIVAIYVDVIAGSGRDPDGVMFYDDLYLDLVLYSNGNILIDDRHELVDAYKNKDITEAQYALAEETQIGLLKGILRDDSLLRGFCMKYLSYMENEEGDLC